MPIPHVTPTGGLSPRTRGSQPLPQEREPWVGSIPAHAGEPTNRIRPSAPQEVYPRARGGAERVNLLLDLVEGLSPRTRGSHPYQHRNASEHGSIPAHAGEPQIVVPGTRVLAVYPRARGGAYRVDAVDRLPPGLSPRTRGSRDRAVRRLRNRGSIPAHAGEPASSGSGAPSTWVYPRARGGAVPKELPWWIFGGLSPRTRGSRL